MRSHLLSLLLPALLAGVRAQAPIALWVQSGEHFNEVVAETDGSGTVAKNAVLVMQEASCPLRIDLRGLPAKNNLVFLIYDKEKSLENIWWKTTATDDLKARYSNGDCNEVLFFKKGTSVLTAPVRWDSAKDEDVLEWIWEQVKIEVTVVNKYKETLSIIQKWLEFSPINPKFEYLYPDEELVIETYPGYYVLFAKGGREKVIYGFIAKDQKRITIDEFTPMPDFDNLVAIENEKANYAADWMFSQGMRTLLNMKQPIFVHGFSDNGYEVKPIPAAVFDNLITHYHEERTKRIDEPIYPRELHIINKDEQKPGLIEVPRELVEKVASALDSVLEAFCSCKLEYASAYGTHEFYEGNIIRRHVTEVYSNVVGALLVLEETRDDSADPWALEITSVDGVRKRLDLAPGTMLVFEPGRMIHGFPQQYQGKRIAIFQIYFRPQTGWDYYISNDMIVNGRTGAQEPLFTTETELLEDAKKYARKDEL